MNVYTIAVARETGADLGFSDRGANHSSGSLKQGDWGAQPPTEKL